MDKLIYCSNIRQLKQELIDNKMIDKEGNYTHGNIITPIKYNGVKTLALVRDNKLNLANFPSLTLLGNYEEVFADDEKHKLYKDVYPYDKAIEYKDETGTHKYYRPQKIGEFA